MEEKKKKTKTRRKKKKMQKPVDVGKIQVITRFTIIYCNKI